MRSSEPGGFRRPWGLVLLLVLLAAPSARADDAATAAEKQLQAVLADLHFEHLEPQRRALVLAELQTLRRHATDRDADAWLRGRLRQELMWWSPALARPNPDARYQIPADPDVPVFVSQGVGPEQGVANISHSGHDRYAWDFVVPIGTTVRAARDGTVRRVIDGFGPSRTGRTDDQHSNAVMILHSDGTFAIYAHLQSGIPVEEGEAVRVGQPIGLSGNSGLAMIPHVHFAVYRGNTDMRSMPIRFGVPGTPGIVPEAGQYFGAVQAPPGRVRVSVNGKPVAKGTRIRVERGSRPDVKVERLDGTGAWKDVSDDEHTRVASLTLWNLHVDEQGVVAAAAEGFDTPDGRKIDRGVAAFQVVHGPGPRPLGSATVELELAPPARAGS